MRHRILLLSLSLVTAVLLATEATATSFSDLLTVLQMSLGAYRPKSVAVMAAEAGDDDDGRADVLRQLVEECGRDLVRAAIVFSSQSETGGGGHAKEASEKDLEGMDVILLLLPDEDGAREPPEAVRERGREAGPRLRLVMHFSGRTDEDVLLAHLNSDAYSDLARVSAVVRREKEEEDLAMMRLLELKGGQLVERCTSEQVTACDEGPVRGRTVRVAYDEWYPIFYERHDGKGFAGLMHDVFDVILTRLELTPVYVRNVDPGVWGRTDENGSWIGMIGMIQREEADISPSAFSPTAERMKVVDFSVDVFNTKYVLFSRRSTGAKISWENYFHEFDRWIWLGILLTGGMLVPALVLVMGHGDGMRARWAFAGSLVLRAFIFKGTDLGRRHSSPRLSWKMTLMVTFSFATVLFVSYRSSLNAFLAVVNPADGIKDLEDVLSDTSGLTYWEGGKIDAYFASQPGETTIGKLYRQYDSDERARITSYVDGIENVVDGDYVLVGEEEAIKALPTYSCKMVMVRDFRFMQGPNSFPIRVGSAGLRDAVNREVLNLLSQGIVDRLRAVHFHSHVSESDCRHSRVDSLGFENVFTPFAAVLLGVAGGAAVLLLEGVAKRAAGSSPTDELDVLKGREEEAESRLREAREILQLSKTSSLRQVWLLRELLK